MKFTGIINDEGELFPIEFSKLPFTPKRVFYIAGVPVNITRGNHAHYKTEQVLFCVKGSIRVELFNGIDTTTQILGPGKHTHVGNLIWDSQTFLTPDAVLLSICSTEYDASDYIIDIDEFIAIINEKDK